MLGTAERAKVEENAVGSNKATGQERVWCMAKRNHRTIGAKRPPNCCNSSAARRVSENTACSDNSLTERPPKRKKMYEGGIAMKNSLRRSYMINRLLTYFFLICNPAIHNFSDISQQYIFCSCII